MTDADRKRLVPGDRVLVRTDGGQTVEYGVKSAPWQLGHGEWVVGLEGIAGGYLLGRVVAKLEAWAERRARA